MEFRDYYETLGVPRAASEKEIRSAFRRLARQYHPDVNPGDKAAEERFKAINEANEVLTDPEKRRLYDQLGARWQEYAQAGAPPGGAEGFGAEGFGAEGFGGGGPGGRRYRTVREEDLRDMFGDESPFSDFFEQYFGRGARGGVGGEPGAGARAGPRPRRGGDAEAQVEVSLAEAYRGTTRTLTFTLPDGQERRIEVTIPAGVDDGSRIRLSGQGLPGRNGGAPGDLYLVVTLRPDLRFERDGADLRTRVIAPLSAFVIGGSARVPTPDARTLELRIPTGSQDGRVFRLRNQGMPRRLGATNERGDLLAEVHVGLPASPSPRERELLEELARLGEAATAAAR